MSLYVKIFLWFWMTQVLIVAALFGWTWVQQRGPNESHMKEVVLATLALRAEAAAAVYEREGLPALRKFWDEQRRAFEVRRRQNNTPTISRTPAFYGVQVTADGPVFSKLAGVGLPRGLHDVLPAALHEPDGVWRAYDGDFWGARLVRTAKGNRYVFVEKSRRTWMPWGTFHDLTHPTAESVGRLLTIGLLIGVVSFALARHLAAPAARLRTATMLFASGELSARVGARPGRRGDELTELGRDFDRMAERIERLVRSERRLLADISHELRSPLARLNVALDLADGEPHAQTTGAQLQRIRRESERLNELIGQLLTLTRLENQLESHEERELIFRPLDLVALSREVASDADFEAGRRKRRVEFKPSASGKRKVSGDAELLRRALENVVRNALRYTAEGTAVQIELEFSPDCKTASWHVRDKGPGVPEESLRELFRPFFRVADARDRQTGGVGLGLAIADRSVRLHGGEMTATNLDGGGLMVTITLPVSQEKPAEVEGSPALALARPV